MINLSPYLSLHNISLSYVGVSILTTYFPVLLLLLRVIIPCFLNCAISLSTDAWLCARISPNFIIDNQFVHLHMPFDKLDRTAFKAHNVQEASDHSQYYRNLSWQERLGITAYLNSVAFNYPINNSPIMDKTKFKASSRNSNG